MIRYQVRSRTLVDVVDEIRRRRLVISPYFQRDFVWRSIHKVEFIDTILKGFPFPQIFLAKGDVDVETMSTTSCVVDGQQRLGAILQYLDNDLPVNGKTYADLTAEEKEQFLKYEVPIIELDIRHDHKDIIEIFKRLNRTFYSLSNIEKLATEYAASEFMLVAKLLSGDLKRVRAQPRPDLFDVAGENEADEDFDSSSISPLIPPSFFDWSRDKDVRETNAYVLSEAIFTGYEISRKVHLMFVLNVLATIHRGFYSRNEVIVELLGELSDDFPQKDQYVTDIEQACRFLNALHFDKDSYWTNKANAFSLVVCLVINKSHVRSLAQEETRTRLSQFADALPPEYEISAKEAVNNKRERILRNDYLEQVIFGRRLSAEAMAAAL